MKTSLNQNSINEDLSYLKNYDLYIKLLNDFPKETKDCLLKNKIYVDKDYVKFDRILPFLTKLKNENIEVIEDYFIDFMLSFPDSLEGEDEIYGYFCQYDFIFEDFSKYYSSSDLINKVLKIIGEISFEGGSRMWYIYFWRQVRRAIEAYVNSKENSRNILINFSNESFNEHPNNFDFFKNYYNLTK